MTVYRLDIHGVEKAFAIHGALKTEIIEDLKGVVGVFDVGIKIAYKGTRDVILHCVGGYVLHTTTIH